MSGGIYSNVQPTMLGLEMSLHHKPPQNNSPNPHHIPPPRHPMAAAAFAPHDHLHHPSKPSYPKSKNQSLTLSDDDEPGAAAAAENSADDGKRKMSPWQRMKWTDNMVRLLIMVVFYIGDEVGSEGNDPSSSAAKKKGVGGVLQKKGKWKSVSRAMMERGFYVSPQQCEDKFNDLNKRYKRVNDILGKGTSCRVVENQSLLDSMDLAPKVKEEVKKLLNSKHLFFREMCAYHNSCGHGGGVQHSPPPEQPPPPQSRSQQKCLHLAEKGPNLNRGAENEGSKSSKGASFDEDEEEEEEDDDDGDDDHDEEDEDEEDNDMDMDERSSRKRGRQGMMNPSSALIQQLDAEVTSIMRDGGKTPSEKRQLLKKKRMALEEQRMGLQSQSLEMEKQRLKWLKFRNKKEREMEREKLMNEKTKLENERMVLLIRQKEMDLIDHHHLHKKSDPSSITG